MYFFASRISHVGWGDMDADDDNDETVGLDGARLHLQASLRSTADAERQANEGVRA